MPNTTDAEAITTFTKGLQHEQLHDKLYRKRPTTIGELIQTSNGYADAKKPNGLPAPLIAKTDITTITIAAMMVMTVMTTVIIVMMIVTPGMMIV